MFKMKYLSNNEIQVEKYSQWKKEYKNAWISLIAKVKSLRIMMNQIR